MRRSTIVLMSIGFFAFTACGVAPAASVSDATNLTYNHSIQPIFIQVCGGCHGPMETAGFNLTTYEGVMLGGFDGPVIVAGSPDDSELVRRQREGHYGQLSEKELDLVADWISNGAAE